MDIGHPGQQRMIKLLVARNKRRHQEICLRMYKVSIEQSTTPEKDRRTSLIRNTKRTIARNQY